MAAGQFKRGRASHVPVTTDATDTSDVVTVLVVDDEPDMRDLAQALLIRSEVLSCHVEVAADGLAGLEAFDRLRADGHRCELVVDLQMPGVGGLQLAEHVL